ncbi:hypothetical protein BCR44DRAFT_131381 [Catenaria anguillulae PL171]|uniref:RNA recognition motif domain-containing protein n=1 Tax=Catenaria anguillulae PL171 TaxID=765915 RepID=A0A1Y2HR05_9FUNG|nr:hypothetical protein BCR44DRAFT_131381 [Catenaria anguillulae PL171]
MDMSRDSPANAVQDVVMSESSSESDSSEEESDGDDDDDEQGLDGEPMPDLDLKQFPAFLRMYLDESMDPAVLAQRLAVMIPTRHLAPEQPPAIRRSKVVVLDNMVSAAEVDEALESETIEECSKFGKVVKCLVRVVRLFLLPISDGPEPSVRIFVRYAKCDGAQAAVVAMNGRYFGGREVFARLYDELWFDLAKYDALVAATNSSRGSTR